METVMRVCFAAPQVVATIQGGLRTQIEQTARRLPQFGVDVSFFDQWHSFDRSTFDLMHIFRASTTTHELAMYMANLGMPYVVSPVLYTRHSFGFVNMTLRVENMVRRLYSGFMTEWGMSRSICAKSAALYPNTTHEARFFAEGMGIDSAKISVIPNGVDARFADADPSLFTKTYGLKNFILYVGNIGAERKNALGFIRAVRHIDHPAVLIGPIYSNAYAQRCLEEAGKNKNLHVLGSIDNASPMLASAYAACSVFALPSAFETPGIAALEAGLAGARVVITQHGGTTDYFGSLAHYVDPTSVEDITKAIRQALEEKSSSGLRDHIQREFLWERVAEKTAAAYRKLRTMQ
jgi:glycosyltransferase involved in cell wall biosynthesis